MIYPVFKGSILSNKTFDYLWVKYLINSDDFIFLSQGLQYIRNNIYLSIFYHKSYIYYYLRLNYSIKLLIAPIVSLERVLQAW